MSSRDIYEETGKNSEICQKYRRGHPKPCQDSSEGHGEEGRGMNSGHHQPYVQSPKIIL